MTRGLERLFRPAILTLFSLGLAGAALGQAFTEFPIPTSGSSPVGITTGPDGNLWFTEFNANKIGRITLTGLVTEFPVPTAGSRPAGIVTGPDGALWFAENGADKVGRITTAGVITEFRILTPGSQSQGIALGPDGALWFTEGAANQIGRITTSGAVTEFPVLTKGGFPEGIVSGPDGNLWFTLAFGSKIGRITTAGAVTEFTIPTSGSLPDTIAVGSDLNLWFTERNGNNIGRITTAGVFTEFPVPTSGSQPVAIAPGPDGNLWFTERAGNKIGRITTGGVFTEFPVPTANSSPDGIVVGQDRALWFTELNANQIGRVTTSSCPTITLSPPALPGGTVGTPYSQTISASGGVLPYSFAVTSGSLPPGLSLSSGGVLSGTPTKSGSYPFTVTVTDESSCTGSILYSINVSSVCPTISLSPSTLPDGTVGIPYSQTISASGGTSPYSFTVTAGSLPPGLSLSSSGVLSGTPTTGGSYPFTVTATDATTCMGSISYSINVGGGCPTISVSPISLPPATSNTFYSQTLTGSGGVGSYTFAVTSGKLPAGLSLSSSGVLSGTPTTAGQSSFGVTATDSQGCVGGRGYFFNVTCPVTVVPASLPGGQVGLAYSQTVSGSGGKAPYSVSIATGSLPPGLSLSATGVLSGTPTALGSFTFTVSVVDANGCEARATYTLVVNANPVISSLTPSSAITGSGSFTLTVDGLGFLSGSAVFWNGSARPTTFVSATRLTALIPAADVAATGTALVTVVNPGGATSSTAGFTICSLPGAPTNLLVKNASNPAGPLAGADPLLLSWQPPATGPVPISYEYRINGDAYTRVTGTSVTAPARLSNDPITLFVRALSCVAGSPGPEASTPAGFYAPAAPVANFALPPSPQAGQPLVFTDTSSPQATSWFWIFDDGGTSTLQSPTHVFTQAGTHQVALIASNGSGSTVKILTIVVAPVSGSVAPQGAVVYFDTSDPERRRASGVRLSGEGRTWLALVADSGEEEVVFLRLIDSGGAVWLERRLVIGAGELALNDIGAWGVTGTYTVELVSSRSYEARLEGAEIARAPIEALPRPQSPPGGVR